jgi:protein TonB
MLLFSVLAHVLLLSVAHPPPPYITRSGEGLTVRLRAAAPPSAASVSTPSPAPALPAAPLRAPEVTPPPLRRVLDTPRASVLSPRPHAAPPERAPTHVEAIAAPADATNVASGVAADVADAGEATQALSGGAGQGGNATGQTAEGAAAADALPAYLLAIGDNARRLRRYPERAQALGHEGRMDVRLIWRPGMSVPQVELQRSSGSALLDRQGVDMLRQAAARTPLPESLRQRTFSLVLPVEFSLER